MGNYNEIKQTLPYYVIYDMLGDSYLSSLIDEKNYGLDYMCYAILYPSIEQAQLVLDTYFKDVKHFEVHEVTMIDKGVV